MAARDFRPIPDVPRGLEPELQRFLDGLKEAVESALGHRGDRAKSCPTKQDMIDAGVTNASSIFL